MTWPCPVDPSGVAGPTRGEAAGPRWRRTSRGRYVPATVDGTRPEQRVVEAYARTDGAGAVTGWAALWLHGAAYFDGAGAPVPLVEGRRRLRSTPQVRVLRALLPDDQVLTRRGVRCTVPERALRDHLAGTGLREAVVAIDMAVAAGITSRRRLRGVLPRRWETALDLADEHSASPQETRLRLVWQLDAGWARPLVNRDVLAEDGRFLGRPDLLDADRGIVGEYAGAVHRDRARHRHDVRREDLFRRAGLEYVEVVGDDLRHPALVVERMEAAAARAGRLPRRWRLGPAPVPLDDRLDHRDAMDRLADGE
ncbi:hypothetical protein [Nocardioides sp. LML1-1-1.1]|uniref:hypothetical protein n=1 Tax=Nocardioides sp. LML1-1-1.1 TaxID=3135248 RepID=UPI0034189C26